MVIQHLPLGLFQKWLKNVSRRSRAWNRKNWWWSCSLRWWASIWTIGGATTCLRAQDQLTMATNSNADSPSGAESVQSQRRVKEDEVRQEEAEKNHSWETKVKQLEYTNDELAEREHWEVKDKQLEDNLKGLAKKKWKNCSSKKRAMSWKSNSWRKRKLAVKEEKCEVKMKKTEEEMNRMEENVWSSRRQRRRDASGFPSGPEEDRWRWGLRTKKENENKKIEDRTEKKKFHELDKEEDELEAQGRGSWWLIRTSITSLCPFYHLFLVSPSKHLSLPILHLDETACF